MKAAKKTGKSKERAKTGGRQATSTPAVAKVTKAAGQSSRNAVPIVARVLLEDRAKNESHDLERLATLRDDPKWAMFRQGNLAPPVVFNGPFDHETETEYRARMLVASIDEFRTMLRHPNVDLATQSLAAKRIEAAWTATFDLGHVDTRQRLTLMRALDSAKWAAPANRLPAFALTFREAEGAFFLRTLRQLRADGIAKLIDAWSVSATGRKPKGGHGKFALVAQAWREITGETVEPQSLKTQWERHVTMQKKRQA